MIGLSQSLSEFLKQSLQSLHIKFLFPATTLVLSTLTILKNFFKYDFSNEISLLIIIIVITSALLYGLNDFLLDIASGKKFQNNWIYIFSLYFEKRRYKKYKIKIEHCNQKITSILIKNDELTFAELLTPEIEEELNESLEWWNNEKNRLSVYLQFHFPSSFQNVLPTSLGNIILASEEYAFKRYCIDTAFLISHLTLILQEKNYLPLIEKERSMLDLLLNSIFVCFIIAIESLFIFGYSTKFDYLVFSLILILFIGLLYYASCSIAVDWGKTICTAFDLYRKDLQKALYLPEFENENLKEEREIWNTISQFIIYGENKFKGFIYNQDPKKQIERKV